MGSNPGQTSSRFERSPSTGTVAGWDALESLRVRWDGRGRRRERPSHHQIRRHDRTLTITTPWRTPDTIPAALGADLKKSRSNKGPGCIRGLCAFVGVRSPPAALLTHEAVVACRDARRVPAKAGISLRPGRDLAQHAAVASWFVIVGTRRCLMHDRGGRCGWSCVCGCYRCQRRMALNFGCHNGDRYFLRKRLASDCRRDKRLCVLVT